MPARSSSFAAARCQRPQPSPATQSDGSQRVTRTTPGRVTPAAEPFTSRLKKKQRLRASSALEGAASSDEDLKEALWGQLLAITEIDPKQMPGYLDELEQRYSDDLDVRLRLAVGRYSTAEQTDSVAGEWNRFAVLLDSLEHSRDPLASTSFLAIASVAARFAANYTLSRDLADRAVQMCRDLRFDLGLGVSLLHRAAAALGLRALGQAQRSLVAFRRTSISREDPFYRVEGLTLKARLHAYRGNLEGRWQHTTSWPG